jgi:two-component system sensor histidine kinase RegB
MLRDLSGDIDTPVRRLERPEQQDRAAAPPLEASGEALRIADSPAQLTPTRSHLRQLFIARNVVLVVGSIGVAGVSAAESALRSPGIAGLLGVLALVNLATGLRLKQCVPVSYTQFLLQILADIVLLSAALCFSGGDASPFVDLYFVPLTIAAATLPWRHTLVAAAAIVGCRELACHYYIPLPPHAAPNHEMVELLAGALIAYFAFSMASTSRRHEQVLARIREDYLKQRHLTELGTMAAITADRMSSPLATMAVVVGELRDGACRSSECQQALDIIASRIELCKQILSRLLASAGFGRVESAAKMPADKFLATIVDKCRLLQPWMAVQCQYEGSLPAPAMLAETSLEQAILVFLNSAPVPTPMEVELSGRWDKKCLQIQICTAGSYPPPEAAAHSSVPLFARKGMAETDRRELFMAKATISRFGGTIDEATRPDGHACVKLSLPLSDLAV